MKNPLNKRLLRELRSEAGKYAVIAILLVATIGFVSGFLVADSSMIAAYEEGGIANPESVMLYGVEPDSRYVALPGQGVYVSAAYAEKYNVGAGSTVTLREKYEETQYSFTIDGIYDYMGAIAVFMPRETLNRTFDLGSGYYGGYFSDAPLTEIDEKYIGSVIDYDTLTKISRQLTVSMGSMAA